MISVIASIGFVITVMTFISGFRMVKKPEQRAEGLMHRVNGYISLSFYIVLAVIAIMHGTPVFYVFFWVIGLALYCLKIFLVRKRLGLRYGGYLGATILITWIVAIFTHLPS